MSARAASNAPRVLIVDDVDSVRSYVADLLEERGYAADTAADGRKALSLIEAGAAPDAILLDVNMPGLDGVSTLRRIRELDGAVPVIMISVVGKASTIVEAMRAGADDYLTKPFEEDELAGALRRVLRHAAAGPGEFEAEARALWEGPTLRALEVTLDQIADTDVTVLIQGESGVGKEIVARAVHETSIRRDGPFVKVNCAALPGSLLESELFGYEKGAFTGALARKTGKFEQAQGGSIFLDEIGEMSADLQAKLLHVLQDGTFARLGGNQELQADARVITATNRDLQARVAEGVFREDLFFRLNVVSLRIPPLRERREEVPALIDHFLRRFCARYHKPSRVLSPRLAALLERYPFPGNIRELENMMKRIVVLESEQTVLDDLVSGSEGTRGGAALEALLEDLEAHAGEVPLREVGRRAAQEAERELIERVLLQTEWNRKQAARILHVSYKTLLQKIRECGLEAD